MEQQIQQQVQQVCGDTHSYKGWLNSDSFLKRAFAIYGYAMVAGLIISIPFFILYFIMIVVIIISVGFSN